MELSPSLHRVNSHSMSVSTLIHMHTHKNSFYIDMDIHFGATLSMLLTISLITEQKRRFGMEGNEIFA